MICSVSAVPATTQPSTGSTTTGIRVNPRMAFTHFNGMLQTASRMAFVRYENAPDAPVRDDDARPSVLRELCACIFTSLNQLDADEFGITLGDRAFFDTLADTYPTDVVECLLELLGTDVTRHMYSDDYMRYLYDTFVFGSLLRHEPRVCLDRLCADLPCIRVAGDARTLAMTEYALCAPHMDAGMSPLKAMVNTDRIRRGMIEVERDYGELLRAIE